MKKIIFYLILLFSNDILSNEITILDDISGQGLEIINHTKVKVHYIGKFEDGTEFDNSYKRGKPISFQLGIRQVIQGWELGLIGMKLGGKRTIFIPSELGYGKNGAGNIIPPNANLIFDIEIIDVEMPGYISISTNEIQKFLNSNYIFVDIRNEIKRKKTGIIPGSFEITAFDDSGKFVPNFLETFQKKIDLNDNIILISDTGEISSILANGFVENLGFKNMYSLDGGINKLIKENFKLKKN